MIKIETIESTGNNRFKLLHSLLSARGIRKHGLALFSGIKIVPELIETFPDRIEFCALRGDQAPPGNIPEHTAVISLAPKLFNRIDQSGTGGPILAARIPPVPSWDADSQLEAKQTRGISLLLGLQDPYNIGAAIRLGAAFQVNKTILLEEAANPFLNRSVRAAGPALLTTPLYSGPSIYNFSSGDHPFVVLSTNKSAIPLNEFDFPETFVLLPGIEGPGVPDNLEENTQITIPTTSLVESLNTTTAIAIALYAYRLQHPLQTQTE